jgi:hypothetical protein
MNVLLYYKQLQLVQKCYFSLPCLTKQSLQIKWAQCFTKINDYTQNCIFLKKEPSDLKNYAVKEIQTFWQKNSLDKTLVYCALASELDELLSAQNSSSQPHKNLCAKIV